MLEYKFPIPIKYKSKYTTNQEPTGIYQEMQTWLLNLDNIMCTRRKARRRQGFLQLLKGF